MGERMEAPVTKAPYRYLVGPGDVLSIAVFDEPKLEEKEVVVSPDGRMSFPLVGTVLVMDRTLAEVQDLVKGALIRTDRFADPKLLNVTVSLKESRSAQVQVVGEVGRQGPVKFHDRLSLVEALGAAGGVLWKTAKAESVGIVRGALDDPRFIAVDLENVLCGADKDVFLEPGDIVMVPPKYVTIMDRYVEQALSPIRSIVGTGEQGIGAAARAP
jgi:polysaccharide export outer membrane protein